MKKFKICMLFVALATVFSCGNSTGNGALIGAGGAALLGAIVGKLAGNTAVGAAVGGAVGAGVGAAVGKHMDKKKAAAQAAAAQANASLMEITDANGLKAYKFVFNEEGIQFATNKADLNAAGKSNITKVADFLKSNTDCDVAVIGHTDNTGSDAINNPLSKKRATSVSDYMKTLGVTAAQIKTVDGEGSKNPAEDNSTAAGRAKNRRVEVYVYANQATIQAAQNGTLD